MNVKNSTFKLATPYEKDSLQQSCHKVAADLGAQWLSGRVLDSGPRGCGYEHHRSHCIVFTPKFGQKHDLNNCYII